MRRYIFFTVMMVLLSVSNVFAQNHIETATVIGSVVRCEDRNGPCFTYLFSSDGREIPVPHDQRTKAILAQINSKLDNYERPKVNFEVWDDGVNKPSLRLRSVPAVEPETLIDREEVVEIAFTKPLMIKPDASSEILMGLYHLDNPTETYFRRGDRVLVHMLYRANGEYKVTLVADRGRTNPQPSTVYQMEESGKICLEVDSINYSDIRYDATPSHLPPRTMLLIADNISGDYSGVPLRIPWKLHDGPGSWEYQVYFSLISREVKKVKGDGALFTYKLTQQGGRWKMQLGDLIRKCTVLK